MADKIENAQGIDMSTESKEMGTLIIHGTEYKTFLTKKYKNRKNWVKPDEKDEVSFIPGTILTLYIKEGDLVKKDQPILILEAMKMENTIFAPFDAKIKKLNVKEGDRIPKGVLMLKYEV
jgi:biotin carboxyl carrier protein